MVHVALEPDIHEALRERALADGRSLAAYAARLIAWAMQTLGREELARQLLPPVTSLERRAAEELAADVSLGAAPEPTRTASELTYDPEGE